MDNSKYRINTTVEILRELSTKPEYLNFFSKRNLSALDVGCAIPINLIALYHDFNFENLIGIDSQKESIIVENWFKDHPIEKNPSLKHASSIYEFYVNNFEPIKADNPNRRTLLTRNNFQQKIQFWPNKSLQSYFNNLKEGVNFDYIILENIVHLLSNNEQADLFEKITNHISKDGLIHIYVYHSDYQIKNQNPITEERLNRLLNGHFSEVIKKIYYAENSTKKKSILFVGKRM